MPKRAFTRCMPQRCQFPDRIWLATPASRLALAGIALAGSVWAGPALDLADRRELIVDHYLIESVTGSQLVQHEPRDEGAVLRFDAPWEGMFSAYCTVIR